jgi:hypothetical protein
MDAWVWILLLVIVAAVVVVVVMSRSRQRENHRVEAAELRDPTADHHLERREKEAAAALRPTSGPPRPSGWRWRPSEPGWSGTRRPPPAQSTSGAPTRWTRT